MSITQIDWLWFYGIGDGTATVDVNMSPDLIGAQICLHGVGPDVVFAGIARYRQWLPASLFASTDYSGPGTEVEHDFGGDWWVWPPAVCDVMSSVTFGLAFYEVVEGWAVARLDHWK